MNLTFDLKKVKKMLPSQGPLEFFVHHNTFHSMEDMPFKKALEHGQKIYEGEVLRKESEYIDDFNTNKIESNTIHKVLDQYSFDQSFDSFQKIFLKEVFLSTRKLISAQDLDPKIGEFVNFKKTKNKFIQYGLFKKFNIDMDEIISPLIFRFLALYFDQGVAYWKMPLRQKGLFETFKFYYKKTNFLSFKWEKNLAKCIHQFESLNSSEIINFIISEFKLEELADEYLFDLGMRYKGWGGLILSFEKHPEWNKKEDIKSSYEDYLCLLLICEYAYFTSLNKIKKESILINLPFVKKESLYSLDFLKICNQSFVKYQSQDEDKLLEVVEKLSDFERQFLWHQAYEESFYKDFLSSFEVHQQKIKKTDVTNEAQIQVVTCIDDREESFRRYLEELDSGIETFGAAGHFGLDIEFKGVFNAHYRALCPDIVKPTKKISEKLEMGFGTRKFFSFWAHLLWIQSLSSKTLIRGFLVQFLTGLISMFSLSLAVISPYLSFKLKSYFKNSLDKKIKTSLMYDQKEGLGGMSFEQMLNHSKALLNTIGLKSKFAPVVAIIGHGSHNLNNPHKAAYDCGACGGGQGAPNARLMATLLNRADIRLKLKEDQIFIPEETIFIGGYHNTCTNEVLFFDLGQDQHIKSAVELIQKAAKIDAVERCRKFEDVPLIVTSEQAYRHCLGRGHNYMQPRPEYGHATNSLCFVGPRWMSKKLFLDRRSFLASYDPHLDNEGADILKNILSAVGPVCSGINLEYYFSFMDNKVYGCDTKLAHNVTSLVGVMNGYQSDLLMGLSWQMIEIHDPFRLMLMVVSKKEKLKKLVDEIPSLNKLVLNSWIHLCVFDPEDKKTYRFIGSELSEVKNDIASIVEYKNSKESFYGQRLARRPGLVKG